MPGPDPDDSQLRPEPRDTALSLSVRSLKVHRASSRACVQQDCIPSMPRKGGIWLEGSRRGWGEAWLWNIPWEKATAPRPGAGGQLATGILCVAAAAVTWVSGRRGGSREGRDSEGWGQRGRDKEHGQFQWRTRTLPRPPSWSYVLVHSLVTPLPPPTCLGQATLTLSFSTQASGSSRTD